MPSLMRPAGDPVYDIGLAVERTALAWQRTILALVVGSVVAARYVSYAVDGPAPILLGVAGTGLGIVALIWTRRRYDKMSSDLKEKREVHPGGGGHLLLVMGSMLCLSALLVLFVLTRG
ncbi:DUF202 domain-containing protein [Timonella senegalensis]|uniref:DUF202 domain-containing protein n=1 Tax=Timonella senegalensis TaxID=1465825 RepID=UPI000687DBF3|nr:DUF202 domain-containing protein [Timonella senegalensis]